MAKLKFKGILKICEDCKTEEIVSVYTFPFDETPSFVYHEENYYCIPCGKKYTDEISYLLQNAKNLTVLTSKFYVKNN